MLRCFLKICERCINYAVQDGDTPLQIKRKRVLMGSHIIAAMVLFPATASADTYERYFAGLATGFSSFVCLVIFFYLCVLKLQPTDFFIQLMCCAHCVPLLMTDLVTSMTLGSPHWPIYVLLTDILLVCETKPSTSVAVVCFCSVWLVVSSVELTFRFGMYNLEWGVPSQESRRDLLCNCDALPCVRSFFQALSSLGSQMLVLILDFMCTRGFAFTVLEEKKRILASIDTANHIATSLSKFDLELASELLALAEIPEELKSSFERILANLKSYRPYLPQSCFANEIESESESESEHSLRISEVSGSGGISSSLSALSTGNAKVPVIGRQFVVTTASIIIINIKNSYDVLEQSQRLFKSLIDDMVSVCSSIITKNKGTLDLFLGDRIYANFGATRNHSSHPMSSVEASQNIIRSSDTILSSYQEGTTSVLFLNIGMASGKLVCGDLGSENIRRYSFIGRMTHLVGVVERAGCQMNVPMLCEQGLYSNVKEMIEICVFHQTIIHDGITLVLYEVIPTTENSNPEEWMYELESRGVGKWDNFNKIATALLLGREANIADIVVDKQNNSDNGRVEILRSFFDVGVPEPLTITSR